MLSWASVPLTLIPPDDVAVCPAIAIVPPPVSHTFRVIVPGVAAAHGSLIDTPLTTRLVPAARLSEAGVATIRSFGVGLGGGQPGIQEDEVSSVGALDR